MARIAPSRPNPVATARTSSGSRRHTAKVATVLLVVVLLVLCCLFRRPWFHGNLGVVDAGRVFRSAQPTTQLTAWIRDYHLRSILNLRGGSYADSWYEAEVQAAKDSGVSFYDLPLSATRRPSRCDLLTIIDTLKSCPYPLLIHCKSGADRTGLASAVYRLIQLGETPEQAELAFSLEFGHIPLGGTEHLHEPLREYAAWLAARGFSHTPERFRDWVRNDYDSTDDPRDPPPLRPGPRFRRS